MQEKMKGKGILDFIKSKGKLPLLVAGALLGVLLLLVGGIGSEQEEAEVESDALAARAAELAEYEAHLEKEIEILCESVAGVSDAVVMVSFERGYLVEYTADRSGDPVTVGSGSSEEAIFGSLAPPAVTGVGVVCRGGSNAAVQRELTELLSTALGISANRVYITGK